MVLDRPFDCAYFCWSDHRKWRQDRIIPTIQSACSPRPMPTNAAEGAQLRPFLLPNGGLVRWPRPSHHWPAMLRAQELKLRLKVSVPAFSATSRYFQVPCEILPTSNWVLLILQSEVFTNYRVPRKVNLKSVFDEMRAMGCIVADSG